MFSHFIESLCGLATIRAYGWTNAYIKKGKQRLDTSQRPYYLLLCIQRWLILVLDLIVAAIAILLVSLSVALRSRVDAGSLGLALVYLMSLSSALTNLVQHWTMLETSIGAIARIKAFSQSTPREDLDDEIGYVPEPTWPSRGELRFENVFASYR